MSTAYVIEAKPEIEHAENGEVGITKGGIHNHQDIHHTEKEIKHGDKALQLIGDERIILTQEDNDRIRRRTDKYVLSILIWVYFLQILDKSVLGQGNVFGLSTDLNLQGNDYSLASIMNAIAQLAWQPFSSYLIVRIPSRYLMTGLCFGWGIAQACMAASTGIGSLLATRFLLGLFEAGCLPLFSILTAQWYRRSEQPVRVAAWYSTNGLATIVASLLAFGLGHVNSPNIKAWQLIFIVTGIVTCLTAPVIFFMIDSDIPSARFLDDEDKAKAIERLRANQTGTGSNEFKWGHVLEMFLDVKSYLWVAMALLLNIGAAVTNAFGPTLISNFGFDKFITALLNMPFGLLQFICILVASYAAQRFANKSIILACFMVPVVIGCALLYAEGVSSNFQQGPALAGYYLLAFLFGGNPLIVSWMVANTAGTTKKSVIMSVFNAGSAAGNIVGPLLFSAADKPHYVPGVKAVLGIFCAMIACVGIQFVVLVFFNRMKRRQRIAHGKPEYIVDTSMNTRYTTYGAEDGVAEVLGQNAFLDMTDRQNDEFTYVY